MCVCVCVFVCVCVSMCILVCVYVCDIITLHLICKLGYILDHSVHGNSKSRFNIVREVLRRMSGH